MNPFLIPPRLLLRALDDLHTIAQAAAGLNDIERRLTERLVAVEELGDRIEAVVRDGIELGESIRGAGERIADLGDGVDERLEAILAMGARVEERIGAVLEVASQVDERIGGVLEVAEKLDARAETVLEAGRGVETAGREVAQTGRLLIEALPVIERAVTMAEPLEGAVERLGRIVDRLPGGSRSRGSGGAGGS